MKKSFFTWLVLFLFASGLLAQDRSILTFGGAGTRFFGYTDERYIGKDKGDYRKAPYKYGGFEVRKKGFGKISPILENLTAGGSFNVVYRDAFTQKSLYAVPSDYIDAKEVPSDNNWALRNKTTINPGYFFGYSKQWYSVELGMTFVMTAIDEKYRIKRATDNTPVRVDGRGWIWSDSETRINFSARVGLENHLNMRADYMRNSYDPVNGTFVIIASFPVLPYLKVNSGGYLYPTESVYIEPVFHIKDFSLALRGGTIVNPKNHHIKKVAIADSIFGSLSLSYVW